jgi:hypothetical protein
MPSDYPLALRQADQARSDFATIEDDLDFHESAALVHSNAG